MKPASFETEPDKPDALNPLNQAVQYSVDGPLHQAVRILKEILAREPGNRTAGAYLADIHSRLGRHDRAVEVLDRLHASGSWAPELEEQRNHIRRVQEDLREIEGSRFRSSGFLQKAVVPDGEGGYYKDTLGFSGSWTFRSECEEYVSPGACLRLLKSLAWLAETHREEKTESSAFHSPEPQDPEGAVVLRRTPKGPVMTLSRVLRDTNRQAWRLEADPVVLGWNPNRQRDALRSLLESPLPVLLPEPLQGESETEEPTASESRPRILLISLGLASDYAVTVLRDRLRQEGFEAAASFIRSMKHLEDYVRSFETPRDLNLRTPHIFGISVLDEVIEPACVLISRIRNRFPDAWVVLGGPSTQTPEQLASLVPDFDLLIRGDADEVLPRAAHILGSFPRTRGLTGRRLQDLRSLPGGLMLQAGNTRIVHRLHHTNLPERYHLPVPEPKKTIYYWQTSRGCPYDCRFCNKWTGRRYHTVVPWEDDDPKKSTAERSALAMIEFLLNRLVLDQPENVSRGELVAELKRSLTDPRASFLVEPREKIFIVIEDDDFLIQRDRVLEFCRLVEELGLQRFFVFSAITSIRTLFRGGDTLDRELLHRMRRCNFQSLDVGSDGLCQGTIDENRKGYTLDRHVIPANAVLKDLGFFCFNNTIVTTPYTTLPQLIESLIFYCVCPYPINIAIEIGIMGHIGNQFTNEDIVNQQYDWRVPEGRDMGHFCMRDQYRVPKDAPEYALNGSHIISYADPKVREIVLEFPNHDPTDFFQEFLNEEDVQEVIDEWIGLPDHRAETRALGRSIAWLRRKHPLWNFQYAIATIREHMATLNLMSFVDYHQRLRGNLIEEDPLFRSISRSRWKTGWHGKSGRIEDSERELRRLIRDCPWYFRPYRDLMYLLARSGRLSEAVALFSQYQRVDPNLRFYHGFFAQVLQAMRLYETVRSERALFHIPRYFTISPLYYFLARVWELAGGGRVTGFQFPAVHPERLEDAYALFDSWTVDLLNDRMADRDGSLQRALTGGRETFLCGIPVRLDVPSNTLIVDYNRVKIHRDKES